MTTSTLHTPLEELLFFQSLRTDGVQPESFARISDLLKANEYIHSSESYDPERLSPGSLQQLYLRLLKDEVRSSSNGNSKGSSAPGQEETNSRKRKLSTPPLQSIDEAAEHTHLLPRLIDRLYARYQSHVVEAVGEDERIYYDTRKEIEEIERGEWDARLKAEQPSAGKVAEAKNGAILDIMRAETEKANAIDSKEQVEGVALIQDPSVNTQKAEPTTKAAEETSQPATGTPLPPTTAASLPPKATATAADSTTGQQPPKQDVFQPPLVPPAQTFTPIQSYQPPTAPRDPQRGTPAAHLGSTRPEKPSGSPVSLQPSAAPGGKGAGSPTGPLENLSEQSTRTAQSNQPKPPRPRQLPNLPPHPQSLAHPPNFNPPRGYNYYPNQPYPPQYAPYGGQPMPGYSPTQAQGMPPYPPPNQPGYPGVYHPPPPGSPYGTQSPYGSFPGFVPGQQPPRPGQPPVGAFSTPTVSATRRAQNLTPINTAVSATKWKSTPRPAKGIPGSPTPPPRSPYLPSSPEPSPEPEQSSEKQSQRKGKEAASSSSRADQTPTRGRGRGRWAGHSSRGRGGRGISQSYDPKDTPTRSQSVASHHTDDHLSTDTGGATTTRRGAAAIKTEIPSTPLASAADDNTSAISTPGSTAATATRSTAGRRNTLRGPDAAQQSTGTRPGTKRKRAPTLDGSAQSPADASFSSTGLGGSFGTGMPMGPAAPPTPALPHRPGFVLASRNFPRVTSTLMNDIMSHKLASIFAKPITDRDVPGYGALIFQPQDLKSIRLAISQGSRFVASLGDAAVPADEGTSDAGAATPGGGGASGSGGGAGAGAGAGPGKATLWVERSPDVLPPRGIVNSAQLEKEITRVFANAVMFNPDPARGFGPLLPRRRRRRRTRGGGRDGDEDGDEDGGGAGGDEESVEGHYEVDDGGAFTRDAREMFVEVEGSVGRWRAAERVEPAVGSVSRVEKEREREKEKEKVEREESEADDEEGESVAGASALASASASAATGTGTGRGRRGRGVAAAAGGG